MGVICSILVEVIRGGSEIRSESDDIEKHGTCATVDIHWHKMSTLKSPS
jgi:hypothetical protein